MTLFFATFCYWGASATWAAIVRSKPYVPQVCFEITPFYHCKNMKYRKLSGLSVITCFTFTGVSYPLLLTVYREQIPSHDDRSYEARTSHIRQQPCNTTGNIIILLRLCMVPYVSFECTEWVLCEIVKYMMSSYKKRLRVFHYWDVGSGAGARWSCTILSNHSISIELTRYRWPISESNSILDSR